MNDLRSWFRTFMLEYENRWVPVFLTVLHWSHCVYLASRYTHRELCCCTSRPTLDATLFIGCRSANMWSPGDGKHESNSWYERGGLSLVRSLDQRSFTTNMSCLYNVNLDAVQIGYLQGVKAKGALACTAYRFMHIIYIEPLTFDLALQFNLSTNRLALKS